MFHPLKWPSVTLFVSNVNSLTPQCVPVRAWNLLYFVRQIWVLAVLLLRMLRRNHAWVVLNYFIGLTFTKVALTSMKLRVLLQQYYGCVPFGESKNRFLIRDSVELTVQRNAKSQWRFCNLGNFENTFKMASSKQLNPSVLVDQAQRLDTGLAGELVEHRFCCSRDCTI